MRKTVVTAALVGAVLAVSAGTLESQGGNVTAYALPFMLGFGLPD